MFEEVLSINATGPTEIIKRVGAKSNSF